MEFPSNIERPFRCSYRRKEFGGKEKSVIFDGFSLRRYMKVEKQWKAIGFVVDDVQLNSYFATITKKSPKQL